MHNNQMDEADILDIVRRLRVNVNGMDNCQWLLDKIKTLGDPLLSTLIEKVIFKVDDSASAINTLLKHVENNRIYKELLKKYRMPQRTDEGDTANGN